MLFSVSINFNPSSCDVKYEQLSAKPYHAPCSLIDEEIATMGFSYHSERDCNNFCARIKNLIDAVWSS